MITRGISYAFAAAAISLSSGTLAQQSTTVGSVNSPVALQNEPSAAGVGVRRATTPSSVAKHIPSVSVLNRRIDIELNSLPIRQVASLISQNTGVSVTVAPSVSTTATITLVAHNDRLSKVLDVIATNTRLMISRTGDGGVVLQPWPTVEVNGKRQQVIGANAPWSDSWDHDKSTSRSSVTLSGIGSGTAATSISVQTSGLGQSFGPTTSVGVGQGSSLDQLTHEQAPGATVSTDSLSQTEVRSEGAADPPAPGSEPGVFGQVGPLPTAEQTRTRRGRAPLALQPAASYSVSSAVSVLVTALSDKSFVITEPGLGPKNEPGVYLTVYRIDGSPAYKTGERLKEVSRVFHKSAMAGQPGTLPASFYLQGMSGPMNAVVTPGTSFGTGRGSSSMVPKPFDSFSGYNSYDSRYSLTPAAPAAPPVSRADAPRANRITRPAVPSPGSPTAPPAPPSVPAGKATPAPPPSPEPKPRDEASDPTKQNTPAGDVLGGGETNNPFDE